MASQGLIDLLKAEEGFSGTPYICSAGKTTIGYGHNLDARPLTEAQAERILKDDIAETNREVRRALPGFGKLSEVRQAVILSMAFQMGIKGLLTFKKFLTYVQANRPDLAAKEMLDSKWAREDSPERAKRHAEMFLNNRWFRGA